MTRRRWRCRANIGRLGAALGEIHLTADEVKNLIRAVFLGGDTSIPIADELDITLAGICDSFGLLQLATLVEEKSGGRPIPDSDVTVDNFGSVDRILAYLRANRR